jgi:1-deoxy-D-xylulose-5-phosphate synthase
VKRIVKNVVAPDNIFENLGLKYLGPVDGHNLKELTDVLTLAKSMEVPLIVHVKTQKGKGHTLAEKNSGNFHGILPAASEKIEQTKKLTYSEVFGKEFTRLAEHNSKLCLVTAAMKYATGSNFFAEKYFSRFFDVGIAEEHAVTFCAGLASQGLIPCFAVYSTFLQRGFDQLIHDAAIEKLHIILAVDHAGLVGEDGETHHGIFDVPMLSVIPNTTVYSPANENELKLCLNEAVNSKGICAVRYPRGLAVTASSTKIYADFEYIKGMGKAIIVTYGRLFDNVKGFAERGFSVLRLVKIIPFPETAFSIIKQYETIFFLEESIVRGGIGEATAAKLYNENKKYNFRLRGITNFVSFGKLSSQMKACGLDCEGIEEFIKDAY